MSDAFWGKPAASFSGLLGGPAAPKSALAF